jgi:BirA family biotin operon repressor/biotin-[acetyl-CoA-carboxylase] ligase
MLQIIVFDELPSTNDAALEFVQNKPCSFLILGRNQTKGRGRLKSRTWISDVENFQGSFIVDLVSLCFPERNSSDLNYYALKSVQQTIRSLCDKEPVLEAPNDLLINNKKVAGILVEISWPYAVIGVGLNTKVSPLETSTDLFSEFGIEMDNITIGELTFDFLIKEIESARKII